MKIKVIEDSAHAFGSMYKGKKSAHRAILIVLVLMELKILQVERVVV